MRGPHWSRDRGWEYQSCRALSLFAGRAGYLPTAGEVHSCALGWRLGWLNLCEQSKVTPLLNKSSWDPLLCQVWGSALWPLTSQAPGLVGGVPTPVKEQPQVKSWAFIVGSWGGAAHSGRDSTRPHWDSNHSQVHWLDDVRLSFQIPAFGTILRFCIFHSSTQVGSRCCIFCS